MASAFLYDAHGHDHEVAIDAITAEIPADQLLWVDIERAEADELAAVAATLAVPDVAVAALDGDALTGSIERYGDHYQFRVPVAPQHGGTDSRSLDFLVGANWLITVRDGDIPFFTAFREQDKAETVIGKMTAPLLAASLLYSHLESYFDAIGKVEMAVDGLDEAVLAERTERLSLARLAAMRRRVTGLRRRLADQRGVFNGLVRPDFDFGGDSAARDHYANLERRFERAIDALDRARDSVASSFELFATKTAQDTNQLIKVLTLATVALGLFGAVAGVFGMNFQTRFSQTGEHGFWIVLGSTLAVIVGSSVIARYRRWI